VDVPNLAHELESAGQSSLVSSTGLAVADPLVGRNQECCRLAQLVDSLPISGAAAVILGEAGMGKTSQLGFAADYAKHHKVAVHVVRGIESEATLPFAAITDLLQPLWDYFASLPMFQREALEVCLALSAGSPHGPLAACAGTLRVLAAAADERPLLILVDDLQWVDPASAQILLFVARRLASEQLGMVFTVRAEPDASPPDTGLPTWSLTGLSAAECGQLADLLGVSVTPQALASLIESTGGNPLAIVERLRVANARDWVSDSSDLHHSLDRTWGRLFDRLPDETQTAVFVVAADHDAGGTHTAEALKSLGLSLSSLAPAERLGLVAALRDGIRLRHPLLRSVVIARTRLAARISAYQALADLADDYSRSWYLAAAAVGPDETVASALVTAATEARQQSGLWVSARTLRRAAELTPDPSVRAERLLQAARDAHFAGDSSCAVTWCDEALRYRDDPSFAVDIQRVAGAALTWMGEPRRALDTMTAAAARARTHDPVRAAQLLAEATAPVAVQGQAYLARDLAEQVEAIWDQSIEAAAASAPTALAMVAEAFTFTGELEKAAPYIGSATERLLSSNLIADLQGAVFLVQCLCWSERYSEAYQQLTTLLHAARQLGSATILSVALGASADIGWWTGHWTTAYADASEALQWATENRQPGLLGYGLSMLARIDAARGDQQICLERAERGRQEVEPRGVGGMRLYRLAAVGLAALSMGHLSDAVANLRQSWELSTRNGLGNPDVIPMAGDLAEALARAGDAARCQGVLDWLNQRADVTGLAYPRAAALRARGILASEADQSQALFAAALAELQRVGPIPFEEARTLLSSGEALRRDRRPVDARDPLNQALEIFETLGARPWADRTRAELAASGMKNQRMTGNRPTPLQELSPQELQVARIAGRGQNNIEVAAALFMSRKTVEAHLTRVYRKLGIHSRTELARVLISNGIFD
jgi:DNA-binding CsgD family transcriptional regulator